MTALAFTVPGDIVPWQRASSRGGQRYTPLRQRMYQDTVRNHALRAVGMGKCSGIKWPLDAIYVLRIVIVRSGWQPFDADNAAKTVMDACRGVLWQDDRARFVRAPWPVVAEPDAENPRTVVLVETADAERVEQVAREWLREASEIQEAM